MSGENNVVKITISRDGQTVTRQGFGTPLLLGYHTNYVDLWRKYGTDLAELVADGFTVNDPIYKMALRAMSQSPKPDGFIVGRRATAFSFAYEMVPVSPEEGEVFSGEVVSPDGTITEISVTAGAAPTVADIVTALQTPLNAIADHTAVDSVTKVECSADNAGELFLLRNWSANVEIKIVTADPGVAADLSAVSAAIATGNEDWYALFLDSQGQAEVAACAAAVEALERTFHYDTPDDDTKDAGDATDVASVLKAASYTRTLGHYHRNMDEYHAVGQASLALPEQPGSINWAYKTVAGSTVDTLSTGDISALEGKNLNYYAPLAGVAVTRFGKMASGEFIDVIRGIDHFASNARADLIQALIDNKKISFDDLGISAVGSILLSRARISERVNKVFVLGSSTVTLPTAAEVSKADKAARKLTGVKCAATLSSAVNAIEFEANITL